MLMNVELSRFVEQLKLISLTPPELIEGKEITKNDINRPALELTGYYEHFDRERVQIIGFVEQSYIQHMSKAKKRACFERLLSQGIPCIIFSRGMMPEDPFLEIAEKYKVPVFSSERATAEIMAESIRWLGVKLAPVIRIHGVLVDVYGEGVLITGESGIGKSEAALELLRRGHRLVSDDVVEIHKVSEETLVGRSPDIIKHFIELRGIGIIDVKMLFGVQSVMDTATIDLVIHLEDWDKDKDYDRLGLEEKHVEYLGNKVLCHDIPIRPGRNLAVIVETAAVNRRQKKMGYDAARELYNRVQESMKAGEEARKAMEES